jgi:hypothetical protein
MDAAPMLSPARMLTLAAAIMLASCHPPVHPPVDDRERPTSAVAVDDPSQVPADRRVVIVERRSGIAPELLQALQQAVADSGDGSAQISVRVVTPDDCGPTVAPGSDCLVGTVAAADE